MRLQLALNVRDLDEAVDYYQKLFGVAPHKRRDGYANFSIETPQRRRRSSSSSSKTPRRPSV
jgi:catechol 2,3-dioxygenase-like lactoylglutathione lyase family enzyme